MLLSCFLWSGSFFLILLLCVIGAGLVLFYKIRSAVRSVAKEAFGTSDLRKAKRMIEEQYEHTPKSVSAQTSFRMPQINRDFPDFSFDQMKSRVNSAITSYLAACDASDANLFKDGSDELKSYLDSHIKLLKENHQDEHFENVKLHQTEICDYKKSGGTCTVVFQTSLQARYFVTNDKGKVVKGTNVATTQTRYKTELVYVQDSSIMEQSTKRGIGLVCPNCAAPITNLGIKKCEYCGTTIIEWNVKVWEIGNIVEC